jgi:hypothetical protein
MCAPVELQLQLLLAPTCGSGSTETRRTLLGGRLKPMRVICRQHLKRFPSRAAGDEATVVTTPSASAPALRRRCRRSLASLYVFLTL